MIAITTNKKPPALKSKTNPAFVDLAYYEVGNDSIRAVTFVENSERGAEGNSFAGRLN